MFIKVFYKLEGNNKPNLYDIKNNKLGFINKNKTNQNKNASIMTDPESDG